MRSTMLNRRFNKKATILVSHQTLEQAIQEGEALAEKILQTNPNDPSLDQIEEAVARLQGVLHITPQEMAAEGASSIEDYLDDAKQPGFAAEIKKDVDMIAQFRQQARGGAGAAAEVPVEAGAGASDQAWVTDRDVNGQPKSPEKGEVPRLAAKKKEAGPPAGAIAPAAPAKTGSPLDYVPTEMILKIVQDLPKQEGFEQNKGMQDALVKMTQILQQRPVVQPKPQEGAAPAPAMPMAASKNAKGEPFGGKQAPPFGKKDKEEEKESCMGSKEGSEEGKRHDDVPVAPTPNVFTSDTKAEDSKTATAPPGWEGTVKEMKHHKDIDNPWALAWSMKDKGYTPHKASFILRKRGAKYLADKIAAESDNWADDGTKGNVLEDGGRTPEVAQAHGMKDEAPAKLDRTATTPMDKLASAVKDAQTVGEKLKAMYLDAKPLLEENSTAPVRNFVESIYKAYSLCDDAVKTLNKQEMQEAAEEEAAKIKEQNKKKSSLLGLRVAAIEE